MNPRIYSYSRISSERQSSGTGLAQQKDIDVLNLLSHKYNMPISKETFSDIGKSAYHGDHLNADFGKILSQIEDGRIAKESILVVSSLDRLSRQDVNIALELFLSVINKGVAIYTSIDDKLYSPTDENLSASLIVSIIYLERANNESRTKAARTIGNAKAIYKSIIEKAPGSTDSDGHIRAIKSVGKNAFWVDCASGYVKPHPIYFPIVRELVDLSLKMFSQRQLKEFLNDKYGDIVPPVMKSRTGDGKIEWSLFFIADFHNYHSLLGRKVINIDGEQLIIKDYYPPVCTPDELAQMQSIRRKRNTRGTQLLNKPTGLLSGINILKCSVCGGGMTHVHKQTQSKGAGRNARYVCSNGANGRKNCTNWGYSQNLIDAYVVKRARLKAFNNLVPKSTTELRELTQKRIILDAKLEESMEDYRELKQAGKKVPRVVMFEISDIETEIEDIDDKIHSMRLQGAGSVLNKTWRDLFSNYHESDILDQSQIELRLRFKQILKQMIIRIDSVRTGVKVWRSYETKFTIEWEDGETEQIIL